MMGLLQGTAIGHVGSQTETGTRNDTDFTRFSIGISNGRSDDDQVTWVQATAWGGLSRLCSELAVKGAAVAATGNMKMSSWKANSGEMRHDLELSVHNFRRLDRKPHQRDKGLVVDELPFDEHR